ncbi:cobalamin B12-binding domain-containing protein [Streptomyces sp. NPDC032161]|uniref:cobalamin B12-binding domain-containing protein n=1 Tax=unclassified Streptomyces TaxID=2593676 RepID=UPI003405AECA
MNTIHEARRHAAPTPAPRCRVVIAKPGLDGHDRGAKVIARALRDAGYEVIYTGLHQTPEQIVATVIAEDAPIIGLSILSGAHLTIVQRVIELLAREDAADVRLMVGGILPDADVSELKALGVDAVFTPGADIRSIVDTTDRLSTPLTKVMESAC